MNYYCSENMQNAGRTKCDESIQCPVYEDDRCCVNCTNVEYCGLKCSCAKKIMEKGGGK